jgi:hypothetical protein
MNIKNFYYNGKLFATAYHRVVIGGQGAYIEFDPSHITVKLKCAPNQEYRYTEKYANCKYYWLCPEDDPSIKVYHQKGTVNYADYQIGRMYVDPNLLTWDTDDGIDLFAEVGNKPGRRYPAHYPEAMDRYIEINGTLDLIELDDLPDFLR